MYELDLDGQEMCNLFDRLVLFFRLSSESYKNMIHILKANLTNLLMQIYNSHSQMKLIINFTYPQVIMLV